MDRNQLQAVQERLQYQFVRPELLMQAFTRKTYSAENSGANHNEVLEFYGDKALEFIVMKKLSKRFGKLGDNSEFCSLKTEGDLTDIKQKLVCKSMLAECISNLGFENMMRMGNGDIKQNIQNCDSVKADLFEAIVGAVAIDSDWNVAILDRVVTAMLDIDGWINDHKLINDLDHISTQNECCHEIKKTMEGYMDRNQLQAVQERLQYQFVRPELLMQAFTRKSYSEENSGANHNEVLEFYGDKALEFIVMKKLSKCFGKLGDNSEFCSLKTEGDLTDIKQKLVCKSMLADCISNLGFENMLRMGNADIKQNIQNGDSVKEDLFEAIVGAVAIDSDWNVSVLNKVVNIMLDIDGLLDASEIINELNYVSMLNEWCQKNINGQLPEYTFAEYDGEFKCVVHLPDTENYFEGVGTSHKKARMDAAKKAYSDLKISDKTVRSLIDEVGEPELDRAINQLQELDQKKYIAKAAYRGYDEGYDANGAKIWRCECFVEGYGSSSVVCSSLKAGKKKVAYEMLCTILGYNK